MLGKILVVVSCLYVVGASVLPGNFADVNELPAETSNLADESSRSCSTSSCNSVCIWLGYPLGGVCIGNDCYCYVSKTNALKLDKTALEAKREFTNEYDVVESDVSARNCNSTVCNTICQWLGFARGQCVGNDCYCYTSKNYAFKIDKATLKSDVADNAGSMAADTDSKIGAGDVLVADNANAMNAAPTPRSCSASSCNTICIWLGYPLGGVCIGNDCYCYVSKNYSVKINN